MVIKFFDMKIYFDESLLLIGLRELSKGRGLYRDKMLIVVNKSMSRFFL